MHQETKVKSKARKQSQQEPDFIIQSRPSPGIALDDHSLGFLEIARMDERFARDWLANMCKRGIVLNKAPEEMNHEEVLEELWDATELIWAGMNKELLH